MNIIFRFILAGILVALILGGIYLATRPRYPVHKNVIATVFWVGQGADADNDFISNVPSAWDAHWTEHYGGVDNPKKRNGFVPSDFTPKENPFYIALPYNDLDDKGIRRSNAADIIPWAKKKNWLGTESMVKNRWVKITYGDKVVYAQWEDAGPSEYDDSAYVFGSAQPKNTFGLHAGIDLSPAVHDALGLGEDVGTALVNWQFVDDNNVPAGPWKRIVTTSQIDWSK